MAAEQTWTVPKKELEDALDLLLSVPARNGVTSSEHIQVQPFDDNGAVMYMSSDLSGCAFVNGSKKFPFKKPFYLDRRLFAPFVSQGKDSRVGEYSFTLKDTKLVIKHGVRMVVCSAYREGSGYNEVPSYKDAKKMEIPTDLAEMLAAATACATGDPVTPQLNAVYVTPTEKGVRLYSSNTTVVFRATVRLKKVPEQAIAFPLTLSDLVKDHEMPDVLWDKKSAMLQSPRGKLWSAVKSAARESFPYKDIDKVVSNCRSGELIASVSAEALSARAGNISNYLSAVTREDLVLSMITEKGSRKMRLKAGTGNTMFTETLTLNKPATADNVVKWPLAEVLPVLIFSKSHGDAHLYSHEGITFYHTKYIELVVARLLDKKKKKEK